MKVLTLKCVNCGAGLEVKEEISNFACAYCGTQQVVERSGGIVSLQKLEDKLDDVKLSTNRAASELALARLQADLAAICAQRDSEISALRAADERSSMVIGWTLIIGVGVAIAMLGWWSVPVIIAGLVFGWRFVGSASGKVKAVSAQAEARIEPLKAQIARHQAIIDSYDFAS